MRKFAPLIIVVAAIAVLLIGFFLIRRSSRDIPQTKPAVTPAIVVTNPSVPSVELSETTMNSMVQELAQAKPGTTASQWRQAHPVEQVDTQNESESVCVQFRRTEKLDNDVQITRTADFYLPDPPESMELPMESAKSALVDTCVLGLVEVELLADKKNVYTSLPLLTTILTRRFGSPGDSRNDPVRSLGQAWRSGDAVVEIDNPAPNTANIASFLSRTTVPLHLYAYLPKFESERQPHLDQAFGFISPFDSPAVFQAALHIAAIESEQAAMSALYEDCLKSPRLDADLKYYQEKHTTPGLARARKASEALWRWMQSSRDLPPQRRAAALLAAYFLLDVATQRLDESEKEAVSGWLQEKQLLPRTRGTAGQIVPIQWLSEARELDLDGPVGEAVLLMSFVPWRASGLVPEKYLRGYKATPGEDALVLPAERDGQLDFTDYVIEMGESYLSEPRSPEMTEWMEYYLAAAYCDQEQLVQHGLERGPDKTTSWQVQRAAAAKGEALKHLRAAIVVKSPRAITAWRKAWRLLAGLPIGFTYYDFGE